MVQLFGIWFNYLVYGIWIIWDINYMEYGLVLYAPSYILLIWISIICIVIYTSYLSSLEASLGYFSNIPSSISIIVASSNSRSVQN